MFPDDWKRCNVTPVYKGGSSSAPGNYHPILVVPVVAKILEKVVASYFEGSQCLSPFQGAYRRGKSAEQLLLVAVDCILTGHSLLAWPDLHKAFDSLDHHILLLQLHGFGVGGGALNWFTNYFSNRYQRVKLHHSYSTWDWLEVAYLKVVPWGPYFFLCM